MSIRSLVRRLGYDVIRYNARSSPVARRTQLFRHHAIDLVVDVGASSGGYRDELRSMGYAGHIVSFEPATEPYRILEERAKKDPHWETVQAALGRAPGKATLHLSQNRESSSFFQISPRHTRAYPGATYVGSEEVTIKRLDDVYEDFRGDASSTFLKIDTQGYEMEVLRGAEASLPHIAGVQVELSLVPLYEAEPSFLNLVEYLQEAGFTLMSVQPVIEDPVTGQLLQIDGLFFRSPA